MPDDPSAVRRNRFTTVDPDLAEHAIRSAYVENNLVLDGDRDGFSFGHWTVDTARFSINRLRADVDMVVDADDLAFHSLSPISPVMARYWNTTVALGAGLRRRYGKHPAELLWNARLRGLRRDLLGVDPTSGTAVADLAARWGFGRRSRFRVAYAREFAEWPEETLRRR